MGHGYDICPKCGCDLWHEYAEAQREERIRKYPDECNCYPFGGPNKRDISKDTFIEKRTVNCWTGPLTNTRRDRELKIYRCHKCGNEFDWPRIAYA